MYRVFLFFFSSVLFNIKPHEKAGQSLEKEELFVFIIRISIVVLEPLLLRFMKLLTDLAIREDQIDSSFSIRFLFLLFYQK